MSSSPISKSKMKPIYWVPDNLGNFCQLCHRLFTYTRRRHHCRRCGHLLCNDCSNHRATLPGLYTFNDNTNLSQGSHRICDSCAFSLSIIQRRPKEHPIPKNESEQRKNLRKTQEIRVSKWRKNIESASASFNRTPTGPPISLYTIDYSSQTGPDVTLPSDRIYQVTVPFGDDMFLYGGQSLDGKTVYGETWKFIRSTGIFQKIPTPPSTENGLGPGKRYGSSGCYLTCGLFIYGGITELSSSGPSGPSNDLWVLPVGPTGSNTKSLSWIPVKMSTTSQIPPKRAFHTLTSMGDEKTLLLFGGDGQDPSESTTTIWEGTIVFKPSKLPGEKPYRVVTWTIWQPTGNIPKNLKHHTAIFTAFPYLSMVVIFGDKGASNQHIPSSAVYRLDLISRHWDLICSGSPNHALIEPPHANIVNSIIPPGRYHHSASLVCGRFIAIMGGQNQNGYVDDLWVADLGDETWYRLSTSVDSGRAIPVRSCSSAVSSGFESIFLFGGISKSGRIHVDVTKLEFELIEDTAQRLKSMSSMAPTSTHSS